MARWVLPSPARRSREADRRRGSASTARQAQQRDREVAGEAEVACVRHLDGREADREVAATRQQDDRPAQRGTVEESPP